MAASVHTARLLDRRRIAVAAALAAVTALAWADLGWMAADPAAMADPGAWSLGYAAAMLAMWAIMMAAMMVPSAAPTILLFASLRRPAASAVPIAFFVAGYLVAWTGFSVAATAAQWALASTSLLSSAMASDGPRLCGALFAVAGLYQFSPLKDACLSHCRSPARFLVERRREGLGGAFVMGAEHGLYCIGCCAPLMALLFAFGVMNLLWIAALSAYVLAEKMLPRGRGLARAAGAAMLAIGIAFLFH
jgi:predicted metal-binding membrane protein